MGAREPGDQSLERAFRRPGERAGQPERKGDTERVAHGGDVLDRDQSCLARDPNADSAAFLEDLLDPRAGVGLGPGDDLRIGQVADAHEQVVNIVGVPRAAPFGEPLQLQLQLVERGRIQELAELLLAEQLAEQIAIERKRRGSSFGERRIALVHVDGDPAEQQRLRERRRALRIDGDELRRPRPQVGHDLLQRGHVEDVSQAFARGLQ